MNRFCQVIIGALLALTLLIPLPVFAAELTIPMQDAAPGDPIEVPVLVKDFSGVAGIQLYIEYDAVYLIIDSINTAALPDATINLSIAGEVIVVWEDFENPVTLADDQALMTIYFTVGPSLGSLMIGFPDDPIYHAELLDETGEIIPVVLHDGGVNITPTGADDLGGPIPERFELHQNYPNPFNPATTVSFTLDRSCGVIFEVFNVAGQRVECLDLGYRSAGSHSFVYQPRSLTSGIYTYRISGEGMSQARQMILIK